jgi:hypothetical protein
MAREFLNPSIRQNIQLLLDKLRPFNSNVNPINMTSDELKWFTEYIQKINEDIKKKSGKAERIFYIIKRFSTDKRDYRIQCSFTSIDKLKKYYPKRIIDQGVITNGINVSEISVDLRDL